VVGALTELADPRALRALENHILREKDAHLRMITESSLKRLRDRLGHFRYVRKAVQQLRNRLSKTPSE
jgi:DNA polymerase III delta subunit